MSVSVTFTVAGREAPAFKDRIRKEAEQQGMSVSEYIVEILAEHLRRQYAKPK